MSWTVEGRSYHNYEEYQRAQAESERARTVRTAQELAAANDRLQQEIRADRGRMDDVRDSVEQQMEISRRIQANVQAVERNQARLQSVILQNERRMRESLTSLEKEITDQDGKLHGVQVDLGTLRQRHQTHVAQVQRELSDVRTRMEQGLAEAEHQRRLAEERVKASIDAVDQKVERDRLERSRAVADRLTLASSELEAATAILGRIEPTLQPLDLSGKLQEVRPEVAAGRLLIAQGNASAALATCTLARSNAESLEHEARTRHVDMEAARYDADRRMTWIDQTVDAGASADLRACYKTEARMVRATIDAARSRLEGRYRNYRLLDIERREDAELLERLEHEILDMVASAPGIADAARKRAQQLEEVVEALEKVYGESGAADQRFAIADDPKSELVADIAFGSSTVRLRLSLDGTMLLDGYGHGSNSECATAAHRVIQALQNRAVVQNARTENAGPPRASALDTPLKATK